MPNVVKLGGGSAKFEGTATASQVLSGATFYSNDKEIKTGTMTNNGAVSQALNAGGSYTIPQGYHDGNGKVTANSLASQTDGTATASQILASATAYVDGVKVTGTMANRGAVSQTLAINGTYTIPAGYHNGSGKVTQSITTLGATTYTPKTTNQTIASGRYLSGTQTIKGDSNLVASNIKSGVSIFGVSGSVQSKYDDRIYHYHIASASKTYTYTFDKPIDPSKSLVIWRDYGEQNVYKVLTSGTRTTFSNGRGYITLTANQIIIEGDVNANQGIVSVIYFDCAKVQFLNTYGITTKITVNGIKYLGTTIEEVDVDKTDIWGTCSWKCSSLSSDYAYTVSPPILLSSTQIGATSGLLSATTYAHFDCAIIERN